MRIILLKDIKSIGRRGELKEIKDGFARNFLIPQKQAEVATPEAMARWQRVWANKEKQGEEDFERINRAKEKLADLVFNVELKTTKDGGVVESVSKQLIKEFLQKQGIEIEKDDIRLDHNLKDAGERKLKIGLGRGEQAELKIMISHN